MSFLSSMHADGFRKDVSECVLARAFEVHQGSKYISIDMLLLEQPFIEVGFSS